MPNTNKSTTNHTHNAGQRTPIKVVSSQNSSGESNTRRVNIVLAPPHDELSQTILDRFDDIDTNNDGYLSADEIDITLGDSSYSGDEAAMVATLRVYIDNFEEFSDDEWGDENDGLTKADITAYDRLRIKNPSSQIVQKINNTFHYCKTKISNSVSSLYNGALDALQGMQGAVGDCYLISAIVGLANISARRAELEAMIVQRSNGTFDVNFPGLSDAVNVTRPTDAEIALFATAGSNGMWLSVFEKAYVASLNRDAYFIVYKSDYDAVPMLGGTAAAGIELVTGNSTDTDILVDVVPKYIQLLTLNDKLVVAMNHNKVVTAGVRRGITSKFRENGLRMGHIYTVMNYQSTGVAEGILSIRNPWGHGGAQWPTSWAIQSGQFSISLTDFWENFSTIAFEQ